MARLAFAWILLIAVLCASVITAPPAQADEALLREKFSEMAGAKFDAVERLVGEIAAIGDSRAARGLEALTEGDLHFRKYDNQVFIRTRVDKTYFILDPITGEEVGTVGRRDTKKVRVNNGLRRAIRAALGGLTLLSKDPIARADAASAVFKSGDPELLDILDTAIEREEVQSIRTALLQARASAILQSDRPEAEKVEVLSVLEARGDRDALSLALSVANDAEGALQKAAFAAAGRIEATLEWWAIAQNVWFGLSLGSVLLLAAIGLAITFGVMGVINMAHGEMVMLGAYTTYVVQEVIRNYAPDLFDFSLAMAIPLAFAVAGAVGVLIERGVIRFLYGRPLETLLATWGISLVLQQAVRTIFGPTNREVGTPDFMAGAFQLGQLSITYNRLYIIIFSLVVLAVLMLVLRRTSLGLQMRAVTQNRRMAGSMGIRTNWVDAMTFGLGSGIAGIAGVALSQVDNVSPNLGQSYIIDSFMVVVFGGVGNLWGTLVAAMTLGVANKFLEPVAGAVLAKVFVLVFIILFIQKRPRGLFALKGRAVDQ